MTQRNLTNLHGKMESTSVIVIFSKFSTFTLIFSDTSFWVGGGAIDF